MFKNEIKNSTKEPLSKNKDSHNKTSWNAKEDHLLLTKVSEIGKKWKVISTFLPDKLPYQCYYRYNNIKPGINKGIWSAEEDRKLIQLYNIYGNKWFKISKEMKHRTGKQIRERFLNNYKKDIKKGKFTDEEDKMLFKLHDIY